MKIDKGIISDVSSENVPEGAVAYSKNVVWSDKYNSLVNEDGFIPINVTIPHTKIGFITINNKVIIFSTDNTNSVIGLYDVELQSYTKIVDRTDLGFNTANYITGEARINYKQELIVAFTDKVGKPKIVNLDTATASDDVQDYLLFPTMKMPQIGIDVVTGGGLDAGSYYVSIQYGQRDGTESNWSIVSQPVGVVDDDVSDGYDNFTGIKSGSATSKAITINLTDLDLTYDLFKIAIIRKVNSVTSVRILNNEYTIKSATKSITYDGSQSYTDGLIEDIIVDNPVYDKIGTFTQLRDILYAGNVELEPEIKFQKYANKIVVNYTTELVDAKLLDDDNSNKVSTDKGFMHGEVYSLYIRLIRTSGTKTAAFHIPGRAVTDADRTDANTTELTALKYQVEDTTNQSGLSSNMGAWENKDELYPDNDEFNSTDIGGSDLRGLKVRHHRFPSLLTTKTQHYASDTEYGISKLDRLGISISNLEFPSDIADKISGYEILYAKRDVNSSTIIGQSLVFFSANPENNSFDNLQDVVWTTGGNWDLDTGKNNDKRIYVPVRNADQIAEHLHVRLHSFDMLFDKPKVQPDYIDNQMLLHISDVDDLYENNGGKVQEDDSVVSWIYALDYADSTKHGSVGVTFPGTSEKIRALSNGKYIPADVEIGNQRNLLAEECYLAKIDTHLTSMLVTRFLAKFDDPIGISMPDGEYTYLTSINKLRSNVYLTFNDQLLVSAGFYDKSNTTPSIQNGDVYISTPSFITTAPRDKDDDIGDDLRNKLAIHRRYVCETVNNANFRYEDDADPYTQFFPKTDPSFVLDLDRDKPFTVAYSKDYTAINDLTDAIANDVEQEVVTTFPNRIIRSLKESRFANTSSWRTFLNNDLYESLTNRGEIVNLQGYGSNRLYIHHRDTLLVTVDQTTLQGDALDVTLGSGDIFKIEPREIRPDKTGFLGTQHDLSCILTPAGYLAVDSEKGNVYLVEGNNFKMITTGISNFLRDNLSVSGKNPYVGNGIQTAWDEKYRRVLLCVQNDSKSYTLSYSLDLNYWSSYHSYKPNGIINTRNKVISNKSGLYEHNSKENKGRYYTANNNMIIDIVLNPKPELTKILESISWRSTMNNITDDKILFDETFDYITIRTPYECTGKVKLEKKGDALSKISNTVNNKGTWSFNDIKNYAIEQGFVNTVFKDFELIDSRLNLSLPFYKSSVLSHNFFIVRLEFINNENKELVFNDLSARMRESEV